MKAQDTQLELARKRAAKDGFDTVKYKREYLGGSLFIALRSKHMHKYAGCPMFILVKGSDLTVFTGKDAWSFIYSDN